MARMGRPRAPEPRVVLGVRVTRSFAERFRAAAAAEGRAIPDLHRAVLHDACTAIERRIGQTRADRAAVAEALEAAETSS